MLGEYNNLATFSKLHWPWVIQYLTKNICLFHHQILFQSYVLHIKRYRIILKSGKNEPGPKIFFFSTFGYFPIFLLANESLRGFLDKYAKWSFAVWFLVLIGLGHRNVQKRGTHVFGRYI